MPPPSFRRTQHPVIWSSSNFAHTSSVSTDERTLAGSSESKDFPTTPVLPLLQMNLVRVCSMLIRHRLVPNSSYHSVFAWWTSSQNNSSSRVSDNGRRWDMLVSNASEGSRQALFDTRLPRFLQISFYGLDPAALNTTAQILNTFIF